MKTKEQIKEAKERIRKCKNEIVNACISLQNAQNLITCVQGKNSANIYETLADIYLDELGQLLRDLKNLEPTGIAEL